MKYADKVLESFKSNQAVVPALWYTEMAYVIGNAAKRGLIPFDMCAPSVARLNLPLATLDTDLRRAAKKSNVAIYLV
jgi:predicted nucleic acid-binding protein